MSGYSQWGLRLYWLDVKGHSELRKCHRKGHPNYTSDICWVTIQFIIHTQTLVKVKGEAIKSYAGRQICKKLVLGNLCI